MATMDNLEELLKEIVYALDFVFGALDADGAPTVREAHLKQLTDELEIPVELSQDSCGLFPVFEEDFLLGVRFPLYH